MKKILIFLNKTYFNIIYILYIINKIIEFPLVIITHIIFIYIYIKNKKNKIKKKKILSLIIIPLISLLIKNIIKKTIFIKRPYINILNKIKKKKIKIPFWLRNNWKNRKDSSFPSGHTIFCSFWIILFKNKKKWYLNIINNILKIIIISRLLLYLHKLQDIIFSLILNFFINKIFLLYFKDKKISCYFCISKIFTTII